MHCADLAGPKLVGGAPSICIRVALLLRQQGRCVPGDVDRHRTRLSFWRRVAQTLRGCRLSSGFLGRAAPLPARLRRAPRDGKMIQARIVRWGHQPLGGWSSRGGVRSLLLHRAK